MERLTTKVGDIYTCSYCENKEAINKLAEFEDFMEEQGFGSLEDLKNTVGNIEKLMLISSKIPYLEQENQALKQQLAEKEINITNEEFEKEVEKTYHQINQDKIKFAIGQLEKVKEKLKTFEFNYNGSIDCCEDYVFDIFDNQIKELKKEMK